MNCFRLFLQRDLRLAYRDRQAYQLAWLFWLIMTLLYPLAIDPDPTFLAKIAPGVLWIGVLLTNLMLLPKIFIDDHQDGTLAEIVQARTKLPSIVCAKLLAQWLTSSLPLCLGAPLLALLLQLPSVAYPALLASLLLGTPIISLLGALLASLTISAQSRQMLLQLLLLPLTVPVLILACATVSQAALGLPYASELAWLGVILILSILFIPLLISKLLPVHYL
jgi:heme exporter protein B